VGIAVTSQSNSGTLNADNFTISNDYISVVCPQTFAINSGTLSLYYGSDKHPKLYLDGTTISGIRASIANPATGSRWCKIKNTFFSKSKSFMSNVPPPPISGKDNDPNQLWEETNGQAMAELAMAYIMTNTVSPNYIYNWIEAEDTSAPLLPVCITSTNSTLVSGGSYIGTPQGGAANNPNTQSSASATYPFSVAGTGGYYIWCRTYSFDSGTNSFWVNIDGASEVSASPGQTGSWSWNRVGPWSLTEGNHTLNITYCDKGAQVDKFLITNDAGATPSGLGTEEHRLEAENFTKLTSAFLTGTDEYIALGQKYVSVPIASGTQTNTPGINDPVDAQQTFTLTGGTTYNIWARMKYAQSGTNGVFYALDNTGGYNTAKVSGTSDWTWVNIGTNLPLVSGIHTLKLINNVPATYLDSFLITSGTAAPVDPDKYLMYALRWAYASCSYPTWGQNADGSDCGADFAASYQLHGLAVLYDWCYQYLGASDRQLIANTLATRGLKMYQAASGTNIPTVPAANWQKEWLQNHMWINEAGLTAAAIALYGDSADPGTFNWLQDGMTRMSNCLAYHGADGADHEGVNYWIFGMDWSFRYFDFAKKNLGVDMWTNPWLEETSTYRLYFSTAANSWYHPTNPNPDEVITSTVDFADCPRADGSAYVLRRLASKYGNSLMQWMAGRIDDLGYDVSPRDPWLNLIWFDGNVPEAGPTDPTNAGLPLSYHFNDMDFTISRSDWSGNESVVGFQCGPPMGHTVLQLNTATNPYVDWGGGHVHPAANNFCVFGNGEWLIRNDGYTGEKLTGFSNTLLVGGSGQLGERASYPWFTMANAVNSAAFIDNNVISSNAAMDYIAGEAAAAYPTASGLGLPGTRFRRRLIYLRPDVLIVLDSVSLNAANALELRFFPEQQIAISGSLAGQYLTSGSTSKLQFTALTSSTTTATTTKSVQMEDESGNPISRLAFSQTPVGGTASNWENAVALTWSALGGTPKSVSMLNDDPSSWKFQVFIGTQSRLITINKNTEAVTLGPLQ
jgi:hypothetical protein